MTEQSYHTTIPMKFCNAFIDEEILGFGEGHEKALGDQTFFAAVQYSGVTGCGYYPFWNLSYARQWNDENKPVVFCIT